MEQITKKRIKRINSLDSDKIPIILLHSMEMFWSLDRIIDDNIAFHLERIKKEYITKKRLKEEISDCLFELGNSMSNDYLNQEKEINIYKELLEYLGFESDDEIAEDIIDDYCMSGSKIKDKNILKMQLIEWAIELESIETLEQGKG